MMVFVMFDMKILPFIFRHTCNVASCRRPRVQSLLRCEFEVQLTCMVGNLKYAIVMPTGADVNDL